MIPFRRINVRHAKFSGLGTADELGSLHTNDLDPIALYGGGGRILHAGGPKLAVDFGNARGDVVVHILLNKGKLPYHRVGVGLFHLVTLLHHGSENREGQDHSDHRNPDKDGQLHPEDHLKEGEDQGHEGAGGEPDGDEVGCLALDHEGKNDHAKPSEGDEEGRPINACKHENGVFKDHTITSFQVCRFIQRYNLDRDLIIPHNRVIVNRVFEIFWSFFNKASGRCFPAFFDKKTSTLAGGGIFLF